MAIGKLARKLLGNNFHSVAKYYRSFFVDLDLVGQSFGNIKESSKVLDLGGGDGELVDILLSRNRSISVTLSDMADQVGGAIKKENLDRVELRPETQLSDVADENYDLIIISDVLHHIPVEKRDQFFQGLAELLYKNPEATLAIKEIELGHFKSRLSMLSDKLITGDRHASLIGREKLKGEMLRYLPEYKASDTELFDHNKPNYCLLFKRKS